MESHPQEQQTTLEQEQIKEQQIKKESLNNSEDQKNVPSPSEVILDSMKSFFQTLDQKAVELSKLPLVEQMSKEFTRVSNQFNQDTNENIQILKKDLTSNLDSMTYYWNLNQKNIELTACELREKTIQEFYRQIKMDVFKNRTNCRSITEINTTSSKILDGMKEKLEDEGFDVKFDIRESFSVVTLEC